MLALRFHVGDDVIELPAREVIEVLPVVDLQRVPHAPDYVAGLLNYRGRPVPVIDLCWVAMQRAAQPLLSTRIILVRHEAAMSSDKLLGLLAERVTETTDGRGADRVDAGDGDGTRHLTVKQLLPMSVREVLFVGP